PSVVDVRIGIAAWSVVFFALAALALAVGILAIAFAMRALRRASTLGGSGTAIRSLVLGIAAVFFGLGSLVFGIIATLRR
ncbi:MAG: hypothetical protein ABJB03_09560, partial [Rhodoglobus sp.]